MPVCKSTKNGISILEVLFAILILGIIATIAFPKFSSQYEVAKLKSMPQESQALVELAKSYAISLNTNVQIQFTYENNTLQNLSIYVTPNIIESLDIDSCLSVTVNPYVTAIIFEPGGKASFKNNSTTLDSDTLRLRYANTQTVTSDILIFRYSGSCQIVKPE